MGHHYIPRYYLRGFSPNFGKQIWTYDRLKKSKFRANIVKIGQENNLYPEELETALAVEVEKPTNVVLDKVRNKIELSPSNKTVLSRYLVTLWKRVPAGKKRINKRIPSVTASVRTHFNSEINRLVLENPELKKRGEERKREADAIIEKINNNPPDAIWHKVVPPDSTPRMADRISEMTWSFFCSPEPLKYCLYLHFEEG